MYIQVSAHSADTQKSSSPITIGTQKLGNLSTKNLCIHIYIHVGELTFQLDVRSRTFQVVITYYFFFIHTALLHVESVRVSDITNVSAKFEWTHIAKNNIHHVKFKVHVYTCA